MPALDLYHNTVKKALIKDGWVIRKLIEDEHVLLIVFDELREEIVRWIT